MSDLLIVLVVSSTVACVYTITTWERYPETLLSGIRDHLLGTDTQPYHDCSQMVSMGKGGTSMTGWNKQVEKHVDTG